MRFFCEGGIWLELRCVQLGKSLSTRGSGIATALCFCVLTLAGARMAGAQTNSFVQIAVGATPPDGSVAAVANGLEITAGGAGIGGTLDQFQFEYQARTNDFDVSVYVQGLTSANLWASAGLMARTTLAPNSEFAGVFVTPGIAGTFFQSRTTTGATAAEAGTFPANPPGTWLRLQSVSNFYTGYASFDGSNWTRLGSVTLPFGTAYLGLALSSHVTNQLARATFLDFDAVTGGTIGSFASPYEPLGPSSRRTELTFSEIMYQPAPRADGLNLEYLEIYNSNPWWDDISGYQLTGPVQYTFPSNTIIPGGGFLVVAAAPSDLSNAYGGITNVVGPYAGTLGALGELQLLDKMGAVFLDATYANVLPWPAGAGGTGHSIILARPSYGEADPRAWAVSDAVGGSPGGPEGYRPSPLRNVVINEFLANHDPGTPGYVELYNHSPAAVDISGCVITDDPSLSKFVVPAGTAIPAAGFVSFPESALGFNLSPGGGVLLFRNPDGSRVEDAVSYEAQGLDVSFGRWPDGASDFYALASNTPAGLNGGILIGDIVINELMYKPISGNDDDQFVELLNKGSNTVSLAGWKFTAGISYTLPAGTVIEPGGYLVVARNTTNLFAKYPNLNSRNTVGNYSGKLAHGGERVALAAPQTVGSALVYPVEDEVTYRTGGRWGRWAHGGGSSLELVNPNTNHRLAYNWADSDETLKSSWTNLVFTGYLDNGDFPGEIYTDDMQYVQVGLLDTGEALVDNLSFIPEGGQGNLIQNGGFENGLLAWTFEGDHTRSSIETAGGLGGYQSAQSLHLRASDGIWTGNNSVEGTLTANRLAPGQTATLSLSGRWLRGSPEVLMRVRGNWIELTGAFPIPANLGTPGLPNSQGVSNPGPAIYNVAHFPALPQTNQAVVVSAQFHNLNPLQAALLYRIDNAITSTPVYVTTPMRDDGTGGDAVAQDGIYSATVPAQAPGTVVAFLVRATDTVNGVTAVFPQVLDDNAGIPREGVIRFGDAIPTGTFGHFHVWLTQNWTNRWGNLGYLANEDNDFTFVDGGGRIIYDAKGRFSGSPSAPLYGSPATQSADQQWTMPADDLMLGTTSFDKQHVPGNGPYLDDTLQREQTSYWMARQIGLPWNYRRYYVLYVNGYRYRALMEDTQIPDGDLISEHWPNDDNGFLYKNSLLFEFTLAPQNIARFNIFQEDSCCPMAAYTTPVDGASQLKLAAYRWTYWLRQYPDSANNFTNVFALINAANAYGDPSYYSDLESLLDTEEYMRMSAIEHATGDGDSLVCGGQQNMFMYKPVNGKITLLKWDWNVGLGNGGWGPDGTNLFSVTNVFTTPATQDSALFEFQTSPPYRRAFLRAFQDIANGPMNSANANPVIDAKYAAFAANGLNIPPYNVLSPENTNSNVGVPGGLASWIATMHDSLLAALTNAGVINVPFTVDTPSIEDAGTNLVTLTGTAPIEVKTILVNGNTWPLVWTTVSNWSVTLPLEFATNLISLQGVDVNGNSLTAAASGLTVIATNLIGTTSAPLRINEWMASNKTTILDPADGKFDDWFELYNPTAVPANLSGYFLTDDLSNPAKFVIPSGVIVPPAGFLLVWADGGLTSANDAPYFYLHANFKLGKSGASIGLFDSQTNLVDTVTFGAQSADVSQGRFPDGGPNIYSMTSPTPGGPNQFLNAAPDLAPISNMVVTVGSLLSFTVIASDAYAPPQTLTFSLASGSPSGAMIDPVSGVFTWTLPATAAGATNVFTVCVTNNGAPPLGASESFSVVGMANPNLVQILGSQIADGQFFVTWTSQPGQTYLLQYKDDLATSGWTTVDGSVYATDTTTTYGDAFTGTNSVRYYRVAIQQ